MKVKLKVSRVGDNLVQSEGDVVEVPDAEGERMVRRGQAERIPSDGREPARSHDKK